MFETERSALVESWMRGKTSLVSLVLVVGTTAPLAQQALSRQDLRAVDPPAVRSVELQPSTPHPPAPAFAGGPEVIGPWTIVQAPATATLIAGGGGLWDWLNVVNAPITLDEAFTGFSLIDDGFANGDAGTIVEMTFAPAVVNQDGTDLVLLDGRYSENSYAVSTGFDGFVIEQAFDATVFGFTGVTRSYFYGEDNGPYEANVMAAPIDLSDLGVPDGGLVSAVRVIITSTQGDLLGLGVSESEVPCLLLDFSTEDDLVTPLVNGQHIDVEFGTVVTITSSGANAGLAIFDSTVGGPNDPSQDLDLLVGTGNTLILQTENFPPNGSDIFPRPNDDEDGGTVTFAFDRSVRPQSLRLIDIDAGDGASSVVLVDGLGRQRVYTVPSNWTGDLTLAQPGHGVLDLTTLAPQLGFGSTATAVESPAFDPDAVVRIDVHLGGSGGLDDLGVCPTQPQAASMSERSGASANAPTLSSSSLPLLGSAWSAVLDCSHHGSGTATLVGRRLPTSGTNTPFGEVLVAGALLLRATSDFSSAASTFTWDIPNDLSLVGMEVHLQGTCEESPSVTDGKAHAIRGGLSNALDLVLGF